MIGFGPHIRKERPGVPQDHFVKTRRHDPGRFMAVDHHGRITALVAEGLDTLERTEIEEFNALDEDTRAEVLAYALDVARAFALAWFATLEGDEPAAQAVSVLTDKDLLEYFATEATDERMADTPFHGKVTITHSHDHATYGSQGGDTSHSHSHTHKGDASHGHHRTTAHSVSGTDMAAKIAELRARQQAQAPEIERMTVMAMTASGEVELEMAVRWDPEAIDPYARMDRNGVKPKGAFVSTLPDTEYAMVAAGADLPQIVDNPGAAWHAILCVEGLRTDEDPGREIMPGACQFPDLPVSLRLQIHDEGGHYGAVTCGRIDEMDREDMQGYNAITGAGVFGTDEHGQTGQLLVDEQTQRFISIDPRAVTVEIVEVEISTNNYYGDDDDCEPELYDWWVRYTDLVIGAATIVATPALQQAVITLANVDLPETPIAIANAPSVSITAAGDEHTIDLAAPPAEWFDNPAFAAGDRRLIRQSDGYYACPLTVTDDGRVFGHVAYWGADHTGFPGKSRKPPHSPTYAHFMTGARATDAGTKVGIGNLTMNCGHASTSLDFEAARAHYKATVANFDGGYGAVQVADVRAGEDEFGIWVAGAICEGVKDSDVRKFMSLGLSGDWRVIAGQLHMIACLAVPVPGFPIAREDAMVASAEIIDLTAVRAGLDAGGELTSLVAAGRVRRISAEERFDALERQVSTLMAENRLAADRAALADLLAG